MSDFVFAGPRDGLHFCTVKSFFLTKTRFPMHRNTYPKITIALLAFFSALSVAWSQTAIISGRITNVGGSGMEDVTVNLTDNAGGSWSDLTDASGAYQFEVPLGGTYTIDPYSNAFPLWGVTTFDAVLISKQALGELQFTSPYQLIAADVDCSNSVELTDTVVLRKLILGIFTEFPCAGSWRFVPADYVFPNALDPFPFPETITIENLTGNVEEQNFIGVKMGDVNTLGGFQATVLEGQVRIDANQNCLVDDGELPLEDWVVSCYGNNGLYFTTTTSTNGLYYFGNVVAGTYDVVLTPPNQLWGVCTDTVFGVTVSFLDTTQADFSVQAVTSCPLLEVDLGALFLRRCFASSYNVLYCNKGTATAEDAWVEVELDPYLTVTGSSIPWSAVNGNTYTFQVGDVEMGQCASFDIDVEVSCEAVLGQTHCSEARIYPDTLCEEVDPLWNGANLEAEVQCQGDEVVFTITNTGEAMTAPVGYIVIEDIMIQMSDMILLGSGQSQSITLPANGSTWRVEVDQVPYNPLNTLVSAAIEGCGVNGNGNFSLGFLSQFPESERGAHTDEDCQENIGAFDPNDKQGFPRGVADGHFIAPGTEIEYLIRFQNTGTDTAFNVQIFDTLSQHLDFTTLRPGSSSHPYKFNLLGSGVVQFVFQNIMLPDSNVNERGSHGYVKFSIMPKADLPDPTVVENQAAIYFDFNAPVITNRTWHTVGEQFLSVSTVNLPAGYQLDVYPNPASEKAVFRLSPDAPDQGTLQVYDRQGRLVRHQLFKSRIFELDAGALTPGLYFFRLESEGRAVAAGKLTVLRQH